MELRDRLQASLGSATRIERELAGGGMSRVFVARDMTLKRDIVVKLLRPELGTTVSNERFRREIALAATLQHPHIVPALAAGELDGLPYYTMPFVRGESLRHHLQTRSIGVVEAIHILRDIASALAHAHAEGVVHRDIKPGNVLLSGGVAVVTDFGVAKALDESAAHVGDQTGLTSTGVAVGTPAYMSPEQASADSRVDHRADIYAFGCLAYELLSGTPPFAHASARELLAAHVHRVPDPLSSRAKTLPHTLGALVMQCLEKTPEARPQSAAELLVALDLVSTPSAAVRPDADAEIGKRGMPPTMRVALAGFGVLLVAILSYMAFHNHGPFDAYVAGKRSPIAVTTAIEYQPSISPDGHQVAFVAQTPNGHKVFISRSEGGRPVLLTAELPGDHFAPKWSPDGSRIAFESNGDIFVVPALPGTPRRVIAATDSSGPALRTPAWSPDGQEIAYVDHRGVWIQRLEGGPPRLIVKGYPIISPAWSPDGTRLAFVEGWPTTLNNISSAQIRTVPASGGPTTNVTDSTQSNVSPVWTPDGRSLLYVSNAGGPSDVYQQPMSPDGRPRGAPIRLTTGLDASTISLSADGSRLAFDAVQRQANVWMANAGGRTSSSVPITSDREQVECISLSHDGHWLAYDSNRSGNFDLYKVRVDGAPGEPVQLTSNAANEWCPDWSPDDREIAFHSARKGPRDIFLMSADGAGERVVVADSLNKFGPRWSMDGRHLAYQAAALHVIVIDRTGSDSWSPGHLVARDIHGFGGLSPDGKWFLAGGDQLRLVSLNGELPRVILDAPAGEQIDWPRWSTDGKTIYAYVGQPVTGSRVGQLSSGSPPRIIAVSVTGGAVRTMLLEDPRRPFLRGQFATDGRRIFFTSASITSDVYLLELKHDPRS